jgi:hypothetical protein
MAGDSIFDSRQGYDPFSCAQPSAGYQLSTQSPTKRQIVSLSSGVKWLGFEVTGHLHLVKRVRIGEGIPQLPKTPSCRGGQLNIYKHLPFTGISVRN